VKKQSPATQKGFVIATVGCRDVWRQVSDYFAFGTRPTQERSHVSRPVTILPIPVQLFVQVVFWPPRNNRLISVCVLFENSWRSAHTTS
jgi:hypothetical protein